MYVNLKNENLESIGKRPRIASKREKIRSIKSEVVGARGIDVAGVQPVKLQLTRSESTGSADCQMTALSGDLANFVVEKSARIGHSCLARGPNCTRRKVSRMLP